MAVYITCQAATRHKWTHVALTPVRQAGTRFTYPGGMEGWVDLGDWLHTMYRHLPTSAVLSQRDPIWNDGAIIIGFFEERHPTKKQNNKYKNKMNSDMGPAPDPKSDL